jgi:hypothetical protein
MSSLMWCLIFLYVRWTVISNGQEYNSSGRALQSESSANRHSRKYMNIRFYNSLSPRGEDDVVMFWRPQKVGSSTFLALLMSHAFRTNKFPRKKGYGANNFCRRIAFCAKFSYNIMDNIVRPDSENTIWTYSDQYIAGKILGAGTKGSATDISAFIRTTKQLESVRFHSSVQHEICNMPTFIVQASLSCAFTQPLYYNMSVSKLNHHNTKITVKPKNVKQLFLVREPVARAISVYYFWGFLFLNGAEAEAKEQRMSDEEQKKKKQIRGMFML